MAAVLGFIGFVLLVTGLIHLYLWLRLVRDTTHPKTRSRRVGGLLVLAAALLIPATLIGTRAAGLRWLAWPGYLWLAVMFYLLVALVVLEVPILVARLVLRSRRRRGEPAPTPTAPAEHAGVVSPSTGTPAAATDGIDPGGTTGSGARLATVAAPDGPGASAGGPLARPGSAGHSRRLLLARGAAIMAGLTAVGVVGSGIRTALGPPRLDRVQIPLPTLPAGMDGFRIALVSDIHLGPLAGRSHTERVVAAVNRLDADLVAVVGDLVDGTVGELGPAAAPLVGLRSRRGAFFVTGNHEYYSGVDEWVAEVSRLGLRPLRNERLEIDGLDLAGVDDLTGAQMGVGGPDFARALGDRDRGRPVVLLAHQPVQAREAARYGVDLQLSGHTHGGQIVPFSLLVRLQQPIVSGYGEIDGTKVYVTNGAGFWGPPVRVGAPPEVTLVELRAPA